MSGYDFRYSNFINWEAGEIEPPTLYDIIALFGRTDYLVASVQHAVTRVGLRNKEHELLVLAQLCVAMARRHQVMVEQATRLAALQPPPPIFVECGKPDECVLRNIPVVSNHRIQEMAKEIKDVFVQLFAKSPPIPPEHANTEYIEEIINRAINREDG